MPNLSFISFRPSWSMKTQVGIYDSGPVNLFPMLPCATPKDHVGFLLAKTGFSHMLRDLKLKRRVSLYRIQCAESNFMSNGIEEDSCIDDEDDENCPIDCVREFKTDEEFLKVLAKAKKTNSLVVVDFYRTSCGSCKYIEQGFVKLCKGSGDQEGGVMFLKHNVIDEYDEQTEVAERLRIRVFATLVHWTAQHTVLCMNVWLLISLVHVSMR
ncbi:hypothetical protein Taro_055610 [Colocasia esculenta]|uniref:Thioredoxin domain-containing protein n=1 Tax=Colocasia esculenta TaxID=4460 RepID=A0A843XUU7_COLES|nr:hypothetical protein [Colocasia esculenta]